MPVSASRYAAGLHTLVRREEPGRLIDTLLVGAIIEARSCERFAALAPVLSPIDPALSDFYSSLLRSEARHWQDYLQLAGQAARSLDPPVGDDAIDARLEAFLARDEALICDADTVLRFHSGVMAGSVVT